jgi:hypothetical protein
MIKALGRRGARMLLIATALLAGAAGVALATIPGSGGVINGCYEKRTGILRVIDAEAGKTCLSFETPISWNQRGQDGAPGPAGADGRDGAPGPPGADGTDGQDGVSVMSEALAAGDANCANGGSKFTAANGITYACNGAPGQDGAPGGPAGFDAQTITETTTLTRTTTDVATITVNAPSAGFVVLTGNGAFRAQHTDGQRDLLRVFLTNVSGRQNFDNLTFYEVPPSAPTGTNSVPFSITRIFPVSAGANSFFMTADVFVGSGFLVRHNLTAIYQATQL